MESLKCFKERIIATKFIFDKKMQAVGRILPVGRKRVKRVKYLSKEKMKVFWTIIVAVGMVRGGQIWTILLRWNG